jgi:hypothetical protein
MRLTCNLIYAETSSLSSPSSAGLSRWYITIVASNPFQNYLRQPKSSPVPTFMPSPGAATLIQKLYRLISSTQSREERYRQPGRKWCDDVLIWLSEESNILLVDLLYRSPNHPLYAFTACCAPSHFAWWVAESLVVWYGCLRHFGAASAVWKRRRRRP